MRVRIKENISQAFNGHHLRGEVVDVVDYAGDYDYVQYTDSAGKNYVFHKNQVEEIFEPKSGMIFETYHGRYGFFVEMPDGSLTMLHVSGVDEYGNSKSRITGYDTFHRHYLMEKNYHDGKSYIARIYAPKDSKGACLQKCAINSYRGEVLWEYVAPVRELTLQEVADKFNIPVDRLRIKE